MSSGSKLVGCAVAALGAAALVAAPFVGGASQTSPPIGVVTARGALRFEGTMTTGIRPWAAVGGGAQCANYGTKSVNGRWRGTLQFTTVQGIPAARLTNDTDPDPTAWPAQNCNLSGPLAGRPGTLVLPSDEYIAMAVYIPSDPKIPNRTRRTNIGEWHLTTSIGPQPALALMLYADRIQAFFDTGLWNGSSYQYNSRHPMAYAIPPRRLVPGAWNEIAFHVHWANDKSGNAQFYYRTRGGTWHNGSSVLNMPTVEHDSVGSTGTSYVDNAPANYGAAFTTRYSVYATDVAESPTSLASVKAVMP